jgi:hypothetical protein
VNGNALGALTLGTGRLGRLTRCTDTALTSSADLVAAGDGTTAGGFTGTGGVTGVGGLAAQPVWAGLVCPIPLLRSHS